MKTLHALHTFMVNKNHEGMKEMKKPHSNPKIIADKKLVNTDFIEKFIHSPPHG